MSTKQYPGYQSTDGETFDFPYHGSGRKSIRHKIPTEEGELHISLTVSEVWEDPSVVLDVAHNFGPGQHVRFNPGRSDYAERVIDGKDGH